MLRNSSRTPSLPARRLDIMRAGSIETCPSCGSPNHVICEQVPIKKIRLQRQSVMRSASMHSAMGEFSRFNYLCASSVVPLFPFFFFISFFLVVLKQPVILQSPTCRLDICFYYYLNIYREKKQQQRVYLFQRGYLHPSRH